MKKILVFCVFLFLLTSCFNKEKEKDKEVIKIDNHPEIKKELSEEEINTQRGEISLDDLDLILALEKIDGKENNKLFNGGKKFLDNLNKTEKNKITERVDGGIKLEDFEKEITKIPENLKREINLDLDIFDYKTKEKISSGVVYMNKIRLGEFKDGKFEKNFYWPIGIEQFKVMVRTPEYGDGFLNLNSINANGSLVIGEIYLKKAVIVKNFDLDKDVNYSGEDLKFSMERCSLIQENGRCFRGKVDLKINFIKGDDVNNNKVSLNMKALTKEGKLVNLQSGGMAFIDFIKDDGEILKLQEGKTIKLTYKVSEDDIKNMGINKYGQDLKNGYWWYDKNRGLWIEGEGNFNLDKDNKTWTIETVSLY